LCAAFRAVPRSLDAWFVEPNSSLPPTYPCSNNLRQSRLSAIASEARLPLLRQPLAKQAITNPSNAWKAMRNKAFAAPVKSSDLLVCKTYRPWRLDRYLETRSSTMRLCAWVSKRWRKEKYRHVHCLGTFQRTRKNSHALQPQKSAHLVERSRLQNRRRSHVRVVI